MCSGHTPKRRAGIGLLHCSGEPASRGREQGRGDPRHLQPGKGTLPHAHPGIEQVCYMLKGRAVAELKGERAELGPGDCCFFPADEPHVFTAIGSEPVELLVIYTPPYEEHPDRVRR
jgi:mannose-6-phosphate isomerase-like protein (cupin superfamily)